MSLRVAVGDQDHIQGSFEAKCTLVEYGDYECPHCGRAHPIVKRVQKHFGKTLRFVFRNFTLAELHPHAFPNRKLACDRLVPFPKTRSTRRAGPHVSIRSDGRSSNGRSVQITHTRSG